VRSADYLLGVVRETLQPRPLVAAAVGLALVLAGVALGLKLGFLAPGEARLGCDDPVKMQEFLRGKASDRKFRLYGAACCRTVWDILTDGRARAAVEAQEVYVDQPAISDAEWRFVNDEARAAFRAAKTPACEAANSPRTAACGATWAIVRLCAPDAAAAAIAACYETVNAVAAPGRRNKASSGPPGSRATVPAPSCSAT
jgi:hypothetical protein